MTRTVLLARVPFSVRPGQRLHLRAVPDAADNLLEDFIGSGGAGTDHDLSTNAKQILPAL